MTSVVKRVGRYRVQNVLGSGAFATVYRATDERLDDTVALKVLADNHSLNLEIRKRFLSEGKALRRVDSPHVIRVHDLGETDAQQPFLVLEYADRGTLAERADGLREIGWTPTWDDVVAVAEPLAEALGAVHRAELVHRDLSPGNVLLTTRGAADEGPTSRLVAPDERLLLADLGLVKDLALHSGYTSAGGTEGFRAPELRGGPARIDGRSDLWSLSALLVWLITGSPPGDSSDERPLSDALVAAALPVDLAGVLDRGLSPDPEDRQPDAATWLAELRAAEGRKAAPANSPGRGDPTEVPAGNDQLTTPPGDDSTIEAPAENERPLAPPGADSGWEPEPASATIALRRGDAEPPRTVVEPGVSVPGSSPENFARTLLGPGADQNPPAADTGPSGTPLNLRLTPESAPENFARTLLGPGAGQNPPGAHNPPASAAPGYTPPAHANPGYTPPAHANPGYTPPAHANPGYTPPASAAPAQAMPNSTPPGYGPLTYGVGTVYGRPGVQTTYGWGHSTGISGFTQLPGWGWRLRHSLWLLAMLPFGLTAWAGFLYIGLHSMRPRWLISAWIYLVGAVVMLGLGVAAPMNENGKFEESWQMNVSVAIFALLWFGGIVHGIISNIGWLHWRASRER